MKNFKDLQKNQQQFNCIKLLRLELKMSQKEFADALGLAQSSIAKYETTVIMPSWAAIRKIIKFANSFDICLKADDFF